jgi:alpha-D-ribose 1-methylphosphonate 5-triphosphate synthase subunit PhnG
MIAEVSPSPTHERAQWMRLLSLAHWPDLEALSRGITDVTHEVLRAPETGLVMLRGRMGSTGAPFNFGEATVTRCAVKLASGEEGHGYVMGRNHSHARTAALCDALLQNEVQSRTIAETVLQPLEARLTERRATLRSKAAATKVDFFTMVRGDV